MSEEMTDAEKMIAQRVGEIRETMRAIARATGAVDENDVTTLLDHILHRIARLELAAGLDE